LKAGRATGTLARVKASGLGCGGDLNGSQVAAVNGSGAWIRGEVYAAGRHFATYSGGTSGTTYFNLADHLGTERVRATVGGTVAETCTSLPFGDWLTCTGGDPSPMHFTGQEHDGETGLDHFPARYYGGRLGRFMSPDPTGIFLGNLNDPQSLNLYSYVRNNPVSFIDPSGLDPCQVSTDPGCISVTATGSAGGGGFYGTGGAISGGGGGGSLPLNCYIGLCLCHWRGNCGIVFHYCSPQSPEYCKTKTTPTQPPQAPQAPGRRTTVNSCLLNAGGSFALRAGADSLGFIPVFGGALSVTAGYGIALMDLATPEGISGASLGFNGAGTATFLADANKATIVGASRALGLGFSRAVAKGIPLVQDIVTFGSLASDVGTFGYQIWGCWAGH
jgi:RHS repeat-associated protein